MGDSSPGTLRLVRQWRCARPYMADALMLLYNYFAEAYYSEKKVPIVSLISFQSINMGHLKQGWIHSIYPTISGKTNMVKISTKYYFYMQIDYIYSIFTGCKSIVWT